MSCVILFFKFIYDKACSVKTPALIILYPHDNQKLFQNYICHFFLSEVSQAVNAEHDASRKIN